MSRLIINEEKKKSTISPGIYGHFSEHLGRCIYEGIFVGENSDIPNVNGMRTDVVEALKDLQIPFLRWPGGCFADEYHWKDGIGPKENRKRMINTHWGGVVEDNSFGTHEYMELCRQLGCKTYINGNLGSGTVQEMSEWVEYMTFKGVSPMADLRAKNGHPEPWKVDYFGVGNENWGCGGNMTPEFYANEYRRYQTYVRDYNRPQEDPNAPDADDEDKPEIEPNIRKVCCGANVDDYFWTEGVMKTCCGPHTPEEAHGYMDYLSLHYYVHPEGWQKKGKATEFSEEGWYKTMYKALYMDELITNHGAIMDQYDPEKKIGLCVDEWGGWYKNEPGTNPGFLYQQNTVRDALIAGITLNIFNKHSDRVKMAALAQVVNVLQAVLLTEGDRMIKTPTYHVMHMYRHHQGASLVESSVTGVEEVGVKNTETKPSGKQFKGIKEWSVPKITESVSINEEGVITITMNNLSMSDAEEVEVQFANTGYQVIEAKIVTSGDVHDYNTFEKPDIVEEKDFDGCAVTEKGLHVVMPANSVVEIRVAR